MYFDRQHDPTDKLEDGFYAAEDAAAPHGVWVFRVKQQPGDAKKWPGRRVISLAKNPYARTFIAIAVLTPDGKPPFWEIRPDATGQQVTAEMRVRVMAARERIAHKSMAFDNRIYRLVTWRNDAQNVAVMAAMRRLLFEDSQTTEEAGQMYARKFGRCRLCNRKLTHPDSVATGIGPECAGTRAHHEL